MKLMAVLFLAVTMWATSCTPPERVAYETVVASKAFLDKVKSQHPECQHSTPIAAGASSTLNICVDLDKATAAKDTLIDIVETLCAGPNFNSGGQCDFPKKGTPAGDQAISKLNAAISAYNQTANDLKAATGAK